MDHEDLVVDEVADGHPAEHLGEELEHEVVPSAAVFPKDLFLEAVPGVDGGRLVVASVQEHVVGIHQLVDEQQEDALDRPRSLVHNVSVEQVEIVLARPSCIYILGWPLVYELLKLNY